MKKIIIRLKVGQFYSAFILLHVILNTIQLEFEHVLGWMKFLFFVEMIFIFLQLQCNIKVKWHQLKEFISVSSRIWINAMRKYIWYDDDKMIRKYPDNDTDTNKCWLCVTMEITTFHGGSLHDYTGGRHRQLGFLNLHIDCWWTPTISKCGLAFNI